MSDIYHNTYFSMNTRFSCIWWGIQKQKSEVLFNEIKKILDKLELVLSSHNPKSELFRINELGFQNRIKTSEYLLKTLIRVEELRKKSLGYFDPDYLNYFPEKLKQPLFSIDMNYKLIQYLNINTKIDLGSIGKGLALEEIEKELLNYNIENAFLSFGESSILTKGRHVNGSYWPFGICNLNDKNKILFSSILKNNAVSISSSKVKIDESNKESYHIFNPINKRVAKNDKTIFVKSDSPVHAEVLSTSLIIATEAEGKKIIDNLSAEEIIEIEYKENNYPKIIKLI